MAATWTDPEDIMPSKKSQNKVGTVGSHLYVESRNIQLTETESGVLVAGERREADAVKGHKSPVIG